MELTPEQEMIRDMARNFAREQLAPGAMERDRTKTFPKAALDFILYVNQ
jgi:alkylation response protein AidB-like acyl-CoA dehydrogenase